MKVYIVTWYSRCHYADMEGDSDYEETGYYYKEYEVM